MESQKRSRSEVFIHRDLQRYTYGWDDTDHNNKKGGTRGVIQIGRERVRRRTRKNEKREKRPKKDDREQERELKKRHTRTDRHCDFSTSS